MELAQKDAAGNLYVEVNNVRITNVSSEEGDTLKIQAYRNQPDGNSLSRGIDLPLDKSDLLTLIGELSLLHKAIKHRPEKDILCQNQ